MLFIDRCDGRRVRGLPTFPAIVPYVVRGRNEASVFFSKDIDVENALRYSRLHSAGAGQERPAGESAAQAGPRPTLFGIAIAAAVRTIALKPRLNRFVHRKRIYQREGISASFVIKRSAEADGDETAAKVAFDPRDTLAEAMGRIEEGISRGRGGAVEDRLSVAHRLPFGKAAVTAAFRLLDRMNLPPPAMLREDPLFTSIHFANLGSIGLDTPFHALYEWGTASIFVVMGRMFQKETPRPDGGTSLRHFINFKITVDERIAEGSYYAHAAALFQRLIARPELLERPPLLSEVEA